MKIPLSCSGFCACVQCNKYCIVYKNPFIFIKTSYYSLLCVFFKVGYYLKYFITHLKQVTFTSGIVNWYIVNISTPDYLSTLLLILTNISYLYSSCLFTIYYIIIWSSTNAIVCQLIQVIQMYYFTWFKRLVKFSWCSTYLTVTHNVLPLYKYVNIVFQKISDITVPYFIDKLLISSKLQPWIYTDINHKIILHNQALI